MPWQKEVAHIIIIININQLQVPYKEYCTEINTGVLILEGVT